MVIKQGSRTSEEFEYSDIEDRINLATRFKAAAAHRAKLAKLEEEDVFRLSDRSLQGPCS